MPTKRSIQTNSQRNCPQDSSSRSLCCSALAALHPRLIKVPAGCPRVKPGDAASRGAVSEFGTLRSPTVMEPKIAQKMCAISTFIESHFQCRRQKQTVLNRHFHALRIQLLCPVALRRRSKRPKHSFASATSLQHKLCKNDANRSFLYAYTAQFWHWGPCRCSDMAFPRHPEASLKTSPLRESPPLWTFGPCLAKTMSKSQLWQNLSEVQQLRLKYFTT